MSAISKCPLESATFLHNAPCIHFRLSSAFLPDSAFRRLLKSKINGGRLGFSFWLCPFFPVRHHLGWSWIGFILSSYPFKTNFRQLVLDWILFFHQSSGFDCPFNKFSSITLFDLDFHCLWSLLGRTGSKWTILIVFSGLQVGRVSDTSIPLPRLKTVRGTECVSSDMQQKHVVSMWTCAWYQHFWHRAWFMSRLGLTAPRDGRSSPTSLRLEAASAECCKGRKESS